MADYGAAVLIPYDMLGAVNYMVRDGINYGLGAVMLTPCPPSGPTIPTTGQIWPRGF